MYTLKLLYKGDHSTNLIKSLKAPTWKSLAENDDVRIILTGNNIKDATNKSNKHDLVYFSRCPSTTCTDSYTGETAPHLSERVTDQAGRDTKLHIVRHCLNSNHKGTILIEGEYLRLYL